MFDDRSKKYSNQYVPLEPVNIDLYEPFVSKSFLDDLKFMAEPLEKKVWANVNSTFVGGGVAEMLQSVVPFARGLGIDARWFVVEGSDVTGERLEEVICRHLGIDPPEPQKKGVIDRLLGK